MRYFISVMLIIVVCGLNAQDKSKFIENFLLDEVGETLIFSYKNEKIKVRLDSILTTYKTDTCIVDEYGNSSNNKYRYIKSKDRDSNVKYILPIFTNLKDNKKIVISIIDDITIDKYFNVELEMNYKSKTGENKFHHIIFYY